MKKFISYTVTIFLLISVNQNAKGNIFRVGTGETYITPNALYQAHLISPGDTIEIKGEIFQGNSALAVWDKDNLLIKGVNGKPHLEANGSYIMGKGIWVLAGNNIIVENIEFSGASVPDQNGAGIRLDGVGMTIRNCYFHDNENGILTSNPEAGDILIEYSEFNHNGFGDGYSHNLYIGHVNKLIFRYNYSHHAFIGHNLKSRANENYILYNRIMDEESGQSSRLIDIPNGGYTEIMGNILMQGPNAENNNLIGYGLEGISNSQPYIYIVNNSLINKRVASCIFLNFHQNSFGVVSNNIFGGSGTLFLGGTITDTSNINQIFVDSLYFVDEMNYHYQITDHSPVINMGNQGILSSNGNLLIPDKVYKHPCQYEPRIIQGLPDVGAYEFNEQSGYDEISENQQYRIYPNPASTTITIERNNKPHEKCVVYLFESNGKFISVTDWESEFNNYTLDINHLNNGLYFILIKHSQKTILLKMIVQHP